MNFLKITYILSFLPLAISDTFRFASHYADHMVLQRSPRQAVIWGFGDTGANVSIHLLHKTFTAKVIQDSRGLSTWKVVLDPVSASGPYQIDAESTSKGKKAVISLKDVFFGDVWICGGQSNMQFPTWMAFKGAEEIAIAKQYTKIRLFTVQRYNSKVPVPELSKSNILQQWSLPSKASLAGYGWTYFSAVCWMYGRRLYDLYKIPIGLISTNYGGTSVEAWSSPKTLSECGIKRHRHSRKSNDKNMPSGLWNAMLYPMLNTTIYGVIWYQGEQNAYHPQTYNCTFPALVRGWRNEWFGGTGGYSQYYLPFGFVQLSALGQDTIIDGFPVIRWKQTADYGFVPNQKLPNTFMAVTMDLLDSKSPYGSIHPRDKTTVAERLLLGARSIAYKEKVYWSGPVASRVEVVVFPKEKRKIVVVHYNPASLQSQGIEVRYNKGFELLLDNSTRWLPVDVVKRSPSSVSLHINNMKQTVTGVRYAWDQQPCLYKLCAVYAANMDLPSPPFIKFGPFQKRNHYNSLLSALYDFVAQITISIV